MDVDRPPFGSGFVGGGVWKGGGGPPPPVF